MQYKSRMKQEMDDANCGTSFGSEDETHFEKED